jgi:hypothetical protein
MDVLAIILACSLHPDDQLVRTLVDVQSSGNRFFVGDLRTLKTNDALRSAEDALRYAEDLRLQGGRPAVGLLGVPLEWAERFGRAPIELFDACTNVSIGTAAFSDYYRRCSVGADSGRARSHTRRRTQRQRALMRARYCIVTSFARDLGVSTAAPVILRELIAGTRPRDDGLVDAPPERSSPIAGKDSLGDGTGAPSLFVRPTALLPGGPGGGAPNRSGSR